MYSINETADPSTFIAGILKEQCHPMTIYTPLSQVIGPVPKLPFVHCYYHSLLVFDRAYIYTVAKKVGFLVLSVY